MNNYLICKQTLNYLAKLAKRLRILVRTYLHDAFDSVLLSCRVRASEELSISIVTFKDLNHSMKRN